MRRNKARLLSGSKDEEIDVVGDGKNDSKHDDEEVQGQDLMKGVLDAAKSGPSYKCYSALCRSGCSVPDGDAYDNCYSATCDAQPHQKDDEDDSEDDGEQDTEDADTEKDKIDEEDDEKEKSTVVGSKSDETISDLGGELLSQDSKAETMDGVEDDTDQEEKPKEDVTSQVKSDITPEVKSSVTSEVKSDVTPEVKSSVTSEVKSDVTSEVNEPMETDDIKKEIKEENKDDDVSSKEKAETADVNGAESAAVKTEVKKEVVEPATGNDITEKSETKMDVEKKDKSSNGTAVKKTASSVEASADTKDTADDKKTDKAKVPPQRNTAMLPALNHTVVGQTIASYIQGGKIQLTPSTVVELEAKMADVGKTSQKVN